MHNNITYLAITMIYPLVLTFSFRSSSITSEIADEFHLSEIYERDCSSVRRSRNCDVRKTGANENADLYALAAIQSDID